MIGKKISHYHIIERLGEGGMGVVYRAQDTKLDRFVALKFLPQHLTASEQDKARFIQEAKAASALDHPNICTIYEINETDDGQLFIAMACYEGETLKNRIISGESHVGAIPRIALKIDECINIAIQIAEGLGKAHEKGIIHRDIKPANIILTSDGVAKIVDFGLAKLSADRLLTKTGTTVGTAAYMSPEQAQGGKVDQRSDIWSLGVVLYEMLTGQRPFLGEYEQAVIYSLINEEPESLKKHCPEVSSGLEQIVNRALAKKPDDRYQNIDELLEDLAAIAEGFDPKKTRSRRSIKKHGFSRKYLLLFICAVILMLLVLNDGAFRDLIFGKRGFSEPAIRLAVLPFVNLTGDPEQEYLSDGFTQEMISQLGRLHAGGLSVIARTSVMRYKKGDTPTEQIGRELGVNYLLEGSVRRDASLVRIATELIKVQDQTQIWADSYEREMSGILALQNDVAKEVAKALAIKLLPAEQARLAGAPIINAEAYDAVLKGQYHWRKLKPQEFDTAQRYFELALAKDPSYAPAYAGLAGVWSGRRQMGIMPAGDVAAQWKAATLRAVALDENSITAHDALSSYLTWYEWDWAGAEPHWRKSIELDPNDATNQAYYSHFLAITGRLDEAVIHIDVAVKLDPFNELILGLHAAVLNFMGRYEEAVATARKALSLQPDSPIANSQLEIALFMLGRHDEILSLRRKNYADDPERLAALERGYAEAGFKGALRHVADLSAERYERSRKRTGTVSLAMTYLKAGDKDKAMYWLEKAFEDRDGNLPYIGRPIWNPLRGDPRFQELLRRLNLPPAGDTK